MTTKETALIETSQRLGIREIAQRLEHLLWDGRTNYVVIRRYVDNKGQVTSGVFSVRSQAEIKDDDEVIARVKVVGDGLMLQLNNMVYVEGGEPVEVTLLAENLLVEDNARKGAMPVTEHLKHDVKVWGKVCPTNYLTIAYDLDGVYIREVQDMAEVLAESDFRFPGRNLFYLAMLITFLEGLGVISIL